MFQKDMTQANHRMRYAIPLMLKLNIPPTPENYVIWYEYAANSTPRLNQIVDKAIRKFGSLPSFVSSDLYREFLLPIEVHKTNDQNQALLTLSSNLTSDTQVALRQLSNLSTTLSQTSTQLKRQPSQENLTQLTALLEQSTLTANKAIKQFGQKLLEAQKELTTLKSTLTNTKRITETDPLTSLANEKGFERYLFTYHQKAEDDLSLLLIDIDDLKGINEEYGQKAGTALIQYVSRLLRAMLPAKGVIARIEVGRFAILLKETELKDASSLANEIQTDIASQKIRYKNTDVLLRQVTVCIGIVTIVGSESPIQLVERAQENLYKAKRSGKNTVAHHQ